ncbi:MAG: tetratricopeptide repeat protein, partial [Candidatus Rokuibacteriota bacterium]
QRSLALAPSDADGYETLAEVLAWAGRAEESLRFIRQAIRLNPRYPFVYLWTLGHAQFVAGRRQDALDTLRKVVAQNPNFVPAHAYLAVLLGEMGRRDEARAAWAVASRLSPGASLAVLQQRLPYRRPADLDRFLTAVRASRLE